MPSHTSLITVAYNSSETLKRFWRETDLGSTVEWIVVDNASTDDSAAVAESLGAKVLRLSKNVGFSAANNLGLESAIGDFIGFVNPDVRVDAGDLGLLRTLASEAGALVAPQLVNPDGSLQPNGRGYPLLSAKIRNRLVGDDSNYLLLADGDKPRPVCWAMGAALLGRRSEFHRISGWDSEFFLYYEDSDIGVRAWKEGIPVLVTPDVRWVHGWARETSTFNWAAWRREISSMARFYTRYPEFLLTRGIAGRVHPNIERGVFSSGPAA